MSWYIKVLKNYAGFEGRARRKEYWFFFLINLLISFALGFVEGLIVGASSGSVPVLGLIYSLAVFVPALAVGVRRLHDTGRSGWWLLISLVPIIGVIVLLVFLFMEGDSGPNEYGENPKAVVA